MIPSPAVLALMTGSLLLASFVLYASGEGLRLIKGWDLQSGGEAQLKRERKTCLLSFILGHVLVLDLFCLVLFVSVADRLHNLFTGAMCAAGTLNANVFGGPTLIVMLLGLVLCGLWMVVNHVDSRAPDFPLVPLKYVLLLPVALVLVAQGVLLAEYLLRLDPTLITSCCATLFGENGKGVGSELVHIPASLLQPLFWAALVLTLVTGAAAAWSSAFYTVYAGLSAIMLPVGLASVVSFISLHVYELPTHHCPFCLLHREYGYVGYLLYGSLFLGAVSGMGAGLASWTGRRPSLREVAPRSARHLAMWSIGGHAVFGATATRLMLISDLRL